MIRPLVSNERGSYDTIPDGKLYLADFEVDGIFDTKKFEEFVQRYIVTDDRSVRGDFNGMMQYPVWKKVADRIRAIAAAGIGDPALRERVVSILKNEFPAREVSGGVETEGTYEWEEENNADYELVKGTWSSYATGSVNWRQPVGRTLLLSAGGTLKGTLDRQTQVQRFEGMSMRDETTFFGSEANASAGLRTRESDDFKLSLGGNNQQYYDPPPDHLMESWSFSGSGEVRKIRLGNNPLSATASGSYATARYTDPPPESGFLTQESRTTSGATEFTYRFSQLGLVLDSDISDTHAIGSYTMTDSFAWSTATLLQRTWNADYARAGVGYGQDEGEYTTVGSDEPVEFQNRDVHGRASGFVKFKDRFSAEGSAKVGANDTQGTFNGWYPSWNGSLSLQWTPPRWTNVLTASYSGQRIDLNEYQQKHGVDGSLSITFRPRDWFKVGVTPSGSVSSTDGYQASDSTSAKIKVNMAYNFTPWDRLWFWAFSGTYVSRYHNAEDIRINGSGWWVGAGASVNMN